MNKTIGLQLLTYGLLLAGLSCLSYFLAPALTRPALITGLAGGALCLLWAFRALAGSPGKAIPVLTLIPITYILLSQTIMLWGGGSQEPAASWAGAVLFLLLILSIAMLMRIVYAGMTFTPPQNAPHQK